MRWVEWEAFSRLFSWECFVTDSGLFGRDFCSCLRWPAFCGGRTQKFSCHGKTSLQAKLPAAAIRTTDKIRAGAWATLWTGVLVAAIVLGSRNLQNFDPALVIYTFAIIFATWGVVYHYSVWIRKPPTRVYWQRGWQLFRQRGVFRSLVHVISLVGTHLLSQTFIAKRSRLRWAMHQLIFWGCLLAAAITFPLVFGWIHFTSAPNDQMVYVTYLFGYPTGQLPPAHVYCATSFSRTGYCGVPRPRRNRLVSLAAHAR